MDGWIGGSMEGHTEPCVSLPAEVCFHLRLHLCILSKSQGTDSLPLDFVRRCEGTPSQDVYSALQVSFCKLGHAELEARCFRNCSWNPISYGTLR